MLFVSDIYTTAPEKFNSTVQKETYSALESLDIPFERVDTDEAITMEDCLQIDKRLNMKTVKTLFLCNRQQTVFYLLITCGDKPFSSKNFSHAMEVSRVSFAPAEKMLEMLGTKVGAATVFGTMIDKNNDVEVVIDKEVLLDEWYGCSDGTTTGYMKVPTKRIIEDFLPYSHHTPTFIDV